MKAIIFGSNGQDGFYLHRLLRKNNIDVFDVNRPLGPADTDITDFKSVTLLIERLKPEFIFHFAANSTTRHEALFDNERIISLGTLNILEATKIFSPHSKVFISGSGLQFENRGIPISESSPFEARDAYSVSRIHSTYTARYYRSLGLKVYVGYFFNHDSPLRTARHLTQKISQYIRQINQTHQPKLLIGDIEVIKEWTYAGDVVEAVYALVNQDHIYEAVIGSGKGYSITEFLDIAFSIVGKDWHDFVSIDAGFTPDYKILVSDPSLIFSLGWKPKTTIHELAEMMIDPKSENLST